MSALEDDLPDPGIADELVYEDGKPVPFKVTDLASAEWAMKKLAKHRARFAESKALAEAEHDRTQAWLAGEQNELDRVEEFFGGMLEHWHRQILETDERRKTIRLPSGELKARKSPDTVTVLDPEAFVCAHGFDSEFVRVTAKPDLAAVKQAVLKDGEALDGVEVVPGEVRFSLITAPPVQPAPVEGF